MTRKQLDSAALADLRSDARSAREQAANGPFFPEKGITREMLLAYAEKCDAQIARYQAGGAHAALLKG